MKKNKAQIATFFVIGVIALILVGTVIYFVTSSTKRQGQKNVKITQQSTVRTQQVSSFISSCLEKSTKDSLILASKQAGYIFTDQKGPQFLSPETPHYDLEISGITYHIGYGNQENTKTLIDYDDIAHQINISVKNNLNDCIDFSALELQGFDITRTDLENIKIELLDNGLSISLYYPVEVVYTKLGERKSYDKFNFNIDTSLKTFYDIAEQIIDDHEGIPSITNSSLDTYRTRYPDLEFNGELVEIPDDEDDTLVKIKDTNLQIKGQNQEFWFVRDNWESS